MWVGVDVGGTFTDLVALDDETGELRTAKVKTTLDNQADGFMGAFEATGVEPRDVDLVVHGTTTATNAVLERKGAKAGLITTGGFRDTLELGRRTRPDLWGLGGSFEPLIPRNLRTEVAERLSALGEVIRDVDPGEVEAAAAALREQGCESVAICFLHAYADDAHERAAREVVAAGWPNDYISISSEVLPEVREFERVTATALNALLQPLISRYLDSLVGRLREADYAKPLLVTTGDGGVANAEHVAAVAVRTLLSGPAAGVTAAAMLARRAGHPNAISADMGGTSFDVALIRDGRPALTNETEVDFRVPVRNPTTDIATIGAGGGSIAHVDRQGILRVGPQSAGSVPGPVAYGRGGEEPTITDANVWLGRLDPARLPGVEGVDRDRIEAALRLSIAEPLAFSVDEAAAAILRVAESALAGAIRLVSVERGVDPRDFVLLPFGGAGPLHAVALARELGLPRVLVPLRPGVISALGCVVADIHQEYVLTKPRLLADFPIEEIGAELERLAAQGREAVVRQGIAHERVSARYGIDMQYEGQFHVLKVTFEEMPGSHEDVAAAFHAAYEERFGSNPHGMVERIVTLRTEVTAHRPDVDISRFAAVTGAGRPPGRRAVYVDGGWRDVDVIDRMTLRPGDAVSGPAVLEQDDTTILLDAASAGKVDVDGNLILEVDV